MILFLTRFQEQQMYEVTVNCWFTVYIQFCFLKDWTPKNSFPVQLSPTEQIRNIRLSKLQ